jgi:signal transduction histidine kinase
MVVLPIIVLSVALVAAVAYGLSLRQDIKSLTAQLALIRTNPTTRAQLTTQTFYRRIVELEASINGLLEEQQRETLENRRSEMAMRQALTNISHDLRTPLTSARGYLQLAEAAETARAHNEEHKGDEHKGDGLFCVAGHKRDRPPCVPGRANYLRIAGERLDALTSLIDQLFEFTQIMEGCDLQLERLDVASILRETLAAHYDELLQAGLSVEVSIPERPLLATGDADALGRIFSNLITNAALHGTERLAVRLDGDARAIAFTNPLPPEDAEKLDVTHLFDRFYTADASRSRQSAGLGLAIVQTLAQRMNIDVSASMEQHTPTAPLLTIQLSFKKNA